MIGESLIHDEGCVFPLRMVEVVRGVSDGDCFLNPSHLTMWYLLNLLSIIPVESVILGGGVFLYCKLEDFCL